MRNWNHGRDFLLKTIDRFLRYLWGIETVLAMIGAQSLLQERFYATYEELKQIFRFSFSFCYSVFTLPMRNWNNKIYLDLLNSVSVFTLPMRNWNLLANLGSIIVLLVFTLPMRNWNIYQCSDPFGSFAVFTLPMRNWNKFVWAPYVPPEFVFTLPMRNWNIAAAASGEKT